MNPASIVVLAMFIASAILSSMSGATSMDTIPYIEIRYPEDGSTVGISETLEVEAEGWDLKNPGLSVSGEDMGYGGPLSGCVFMTTTGDVIEDEESIEYPSQSKVHMKCKHDLNLKGFENEKVKVSVSVDEGYGKLTDSVGLYVSGHCG